ncbi:MgtC family protein [Listeria floridensis FSL S10-1187]|uniref:MgtC family protein n=1 Tax=Listeria floridensis FSL S10-1187 TaxID=1265817 RepID=A0ABN0RIZ6_9LIST|nr:MgtC/SapB family protein [Listeria floridensis]EUJ33878.1 MgtC family protein [Listeria floridensis FSL S10-1187]
MWLEFLLRLSVAGILGGIIGLDRELRAKEAGFRTHFLVSLGSALIMIVSQYGFFGVTGHDNVSFDPSRVAAQVVSGIGFIGAGTIIIQKQFVRGLTTAAGLWATSGIGLATGAGLYSLGVGATVLTLIGLEALSLFTKSVGYHTVLLIYSTSDRKNLVNITNYLHEHDYLISTYETKREPFGDVEAYQVTMQIKSKSIQEEKNLFHFVQTRPHVTLERME